MRFDELSLHPDIQKAILAMGFSELTPIQEQCWQPGIEGRDIAGVSQTGTGKTVAFLLPLLHDLLANPQEGIHALIVSPTRELCLQIAEEAERLCQFHETRVVAIYGGEDYNKQERRLAAKPSLIVATPGRLIDFMKQGKINTGDLRFLVLDEADRMLDMGFIRDVRYIMRHVPEAARTFLFSATLSYYIMRLAADFMHNPVEVRIESESVAVDKIDQQLLHLGRDEKEIYLVNQILALTDPRVIVFSNYKHAVERIVKQLHRYGIAATGLSSLLDQKKRLRLLKDFKLGHYQVLVATDVASRGLDVDDVTHVINFDLPQDAESYVHRIGRTARAGKSGCSISYCSEEDYENLPRIKRYIGQEIPAGEMNAAWFNKPGGSFQRFQDPHQGRPSPKEPSEKRQAAQEPRGRGPKSDRPATAEAGANQNKKKRRRNRRSGKDRTRDEQLVEVGATEERQASGPKGKRTRPAPARPADTSYRPKNYKTNSPKQSGLWQRVKGLFRKS
ncbi:MAG: DEAD/DEAH box helicase [Leptospiraceae bacterium]|nr:DEAD/DEAH box helicase [Leptospiraceae bacterium]